MNRKVWIFVGINRYSEKWLAGLRHAVSDAHSLAGFFEHRAGFRVHKLEALGGRSCWSRR